MKKSLVALAALVATGAFAQVTITGGVSQGFARVDGVTTMQGVDAVNSNSFNFTATEDLGGGMTATAYINNRLTANNADAASGDLAVTLSGGFGSVKLGKYTQVSYSGLNPFASRAVTSLSMGAQNSVTTNNNASYTTPSFNGLTVTVGTGYTGTQGESAARVLKANYAAGPLALQAATVTGQLAANSSNEAVVTTTFGGSYNLGAMTVYAQSMSATAAYGGSTLANKKSGTAVGVSVPMGALTLKAGFMDQKEEGSATDTLKDRTSFGVDYALSKRTTFIAETASDKLVTTGSSAKRNYFVGMAHTF